MAEKLTNKRAWLRVEKRERPAVAQADLERQWAKLKPEQKKWRGKRAIPKELEWQAKQRAAITATIPGLSDKNWVGGYLLGAGSYGVACLWLLPDAHGRIVKRQVVKDCLMTEESRLWDLPQTWYGPMEDRITNELKAMQTFWNDPSCMNENHDKSQFVQLVGFSALDVPRRMQRLRMEFCPNGDLDQLVKHYALQINGDYVFYGRVQTARLPEPFLWYVFETLIKACLVMEQGSIQPTLASAWHEVVVHRDLKLENIFLSMPDSTYYAAYPRPVVGDFGLACFLPVPGSLVEPGPNPAYYQVAGTEGWKAPEQDTDWARVGGQASWTIESHTNVWAVGAVISRLMDVDTSEGPLRPDFKITAHRQELFGSYGPLAPAGFYSKELQDLVSGCMRFNPTTRTTPRQALRRINAAIMASTATQAARDITDPAALGVEAQVLRQDYRLAAQMPNRPDPETGEPS